MSMNNNHLQAEMNLLRAKNDLLEQEISALKSYIETIKGSDSNTVHVEKGVGVDLSPLEGRRLDEYEKYKSAMFEKMSFLSQNYHISYSHEEKKFLTTAIYLMIKGGEDPDNGGNVSNRELMDALGVMQIDTLVKYRNSLCAAKPLDKNKTCYNEEGKVVNVSNGDHVMPILSYMKQGTRKPGHYRTFIFSDIEIGNSIDVGF